MLCLYYDDEDFDRDDDDCDENLKILIVVRI